MAAEESGGTVNVRRGAVIAWVSALMLLIFVAAFDNQWTAHWRESQGSGLSSDGLTALDGSGGLHSWTREPVFDLSALSWRISPESGEPGRAFAGNLTAVLLAILLTGVLISLVCRGVGTTRGRLPLFFGAWFSVAAATAIAVIVGQAVAGTAGMSFTHGTTYYFFIGTGLGFALFIGWLIALTAVVVYNVSGGLDDLSIASGYQPPSSTYDYGLSGIASDYGIGPTQSAPARYYPPSSSDPGETPTRPIDPFNRN
jgi:hypothetical protein